jgi:hypothetical protein
MKSVYDLSVFASIKPGRPPEIVWKGHQEDDQHAKTFYYATCLLQENGSIPPSSVDDDASNNVGVVARQNIFPRPWWVTSDKTLKSQEKHEMVVGSQIWDIWRLLSILKVQDGWGLSGAQMWSTGDAPGAGAAMCAKDIIFQVLKGSNTAGENVTFDPPVRRTR